MTRVTLYGKPGCHLCEEAREAIALVRAEGDFELEEVDVSIDPELHARYGERIPVVAVDGREALDFHVDPDGLRRLLGRVSP